MVVAFRLIVVHIHPILPFVFLTLSDNIGIILQYIVLTQVHNTTTTISLEFALSVARRRSFLDTSGVTTVALNFHLHHLRGADIHTTLNHNNTTAPTPFHLESPLLVNLSTMLHPIQIILASLLALRRLCTLKSKP